MPSAPATAIVSPLGDQAIVFIKPFPQRASSTTLSAFSEEMASGLNVAVGMSKGLAITVGRFVGITVGWEIGVMPLHDDKKRKQKVEKVKK